MTFDPAVASTLIRKHTLRFLVGQMAGPSRLMRLSLMRVLILTQVKINITGAYDVAGNLQVDHTATVDLEVDTLNPTASTLSIVVTDNDQTDGDAVSSFTVSTSDLDPGTIHVDMRGSEHTLTHLDQVFLHCGCEPGDH